MIWLMIGSLLMATLAVLHSYIGETRLLQKLLAKPDLPLLQGSIHYTRTVLRWAWHLTSIAWLGFVAIFFALIQVPSVARQSLGVILTATLGLSAFIAFAASGGRHLAWVFFLAASICMWFGIK